MTVKSRTGQCEDIQLGPEGRIFWRADSSVEEFAYL